MNKLLLLCSALSAFCAQAQPKYFYKKLSGTLGADIQVSMDLNREDSMLSGSYKYLRMDIPIRVSGHFRPGGQIVLEEMDEKLEKVTAVFRGTLNSAGVFIGIWNSKVNGKSFPFTLKETRNGYACAIVNHLTGEDCTHRDKVLTDPELLETASYFDTTCSSFRITALSIVGGIPDIDAEINREIGNAAFGEKSGGSAQGYLREFREQAAESVLTREISCSLTCNDKNLLSVMLRESGYDGGAAHGYYGFYMLHFDRQSGHRFKLADLIPEAYHTTLNSIAERLFLEQNGEEGWFFERGSFTVNENFEIRHDGLTFYYNIYEVGPYSAGATEVFIPYSEIAAMIPQESILRRFMKL
jgi:hypothetical protein